MNERVAKDAINTFNELFEEFVRQEREKVG